MAEVRESRDVKGANEYDPEFCQRIVAEFPEIVAALWNECRDLSDIRDRTRVFANLYKSLRRVFGDALLFIAQAQRPEASSGRRRRLFRTAFWYDPRCPEEDNQRLWPPSECREPFHSDILEKVLRVPSKWVVYSHSDLVRHETGPLGRLLQNLAAIRVWFYGQETLCIGISKLQDVGEVDPWVGSDVRILTYLSELLATPLRLENEYLEATLFKETCKAGIPVEVARVGERILRPRIQLAWRARAALGSETFRPYKPDKNNPPTVSGNYNSLVAQYLDAKRYVIARSPEIAPAAHDKPIEEFARLFDIRDRQGERLTLYASPDSEPGRRYEDSFALDEQAVLARHATARALFWLGYQADMLPGGEDLQRKCRFGGRGKAHAQCKGDGRCLRALEQFTKGDEPTREEMEEPASVYSSWLRCLWVDLYYRSRRIREHRGVESEGLLQDLAQKYAQAAGASNEVFQRALGALPRKEEEEEKSLKIDWRWLYLWFLANVTSSDKLRREYKTYDQARHGFRSHLDYYRDASTAVLFGLHLLRFWEAPTVPELWDLPEVRPDEVTQARVRLLCEYAYVELGVDRAWQLEHHLGAQFESDMLLQASSPASRDHTFHVMDVCLLGELLLRSTDPEGQPSPLAKGVLGKTTKGAIDAMLKLWYPAALLHDVGYALALTQRLPDLLEHLATPHLEEYAQAVREGVKGAHDALDKKIEKQVGENGLTLTKPTEGISRDHGIVSANHLIHSLSSAAGDNKRFLKKQETKEVLHAILRHNRAEEHFSATREPLSFFLILCDHLQEWDRPRVRSKRLAMSLLASAQTSMPFWVDRQAAARYLAPSAAYDSAANALVFHAGPPRLKLHYSAPESALLEPACLWVDTCADFERVRFDRRFPDLQLVFAHPPSEVLARSGYGVFEMELLRDFSTTPEGAFLADWLEAIRTKPEDELFYSMDSEKRVESFGLHLGHRRSQTPRLLSAVPEDFYSQFAKWKERHLRLAPDED
jgi:hypothetical protein